jgi:hypothetical protein
MAASGLPRPWPAAVIRRSGEALGGDDCGTARSVALLGRLAGR